MATTNRPGDPFETVIAHLEHMGVEVLADERLAVAVATTAGHARALTRLLDRIATMHTPAPRSLRTGRPEFVTQVESWHRGQTLPGHLTIGEVYGERGPEAAHWHCARCSRLSPRHPNRSSATASAWLHVDLNICPEVKEP